MTSKLAGSGAGTLLDAHVRGYAEAVRLHLADLGPEVTEDLTDGLEADLTEAIADTAPAPAGRSDDDVALDLAAHFGAPAAYAAELRAAAGLPPAGPPRRRPGMQAAVAHRWRLRAERWAEQWRPLTSTPQWAAVTTFARDLRPVWWVARGWLVGSWLNALADGEALLLVPTTVSDLVFPLLATLVSVQWGRGRWLAWRWMPRVVVAVSLGALLMTPSFVDSTHRAVLYGTTGSTGVADSYAAGYDDATQASFTHESVEDTRDQGVWVDGMQVSNLFAYDANGDPLKDVQLFDDRGRPVRTIPRGWETAEWSVPDVEGLWLFRPALASDGRERWNVYPLRGVLESQMGYSDDGTRMEPQVGVRPESMPWPFLKAPTAIAPATPPDALSQGDQEPGGTETRPGSGPSAPAEAPASGTVPPAGGSVLEASPVE